MKRVLFLSLAGIFLFNGLCTPVAQAQKGDTYNTPPHLSGDRLKEMGWEAHQEVNRYRRRRNLPPLAWSEVVYKECLDHSRDMARSGRLSHDGFNRRVANIRAKVSANGVAENVAYNWNVDDPVRVAVQGWIDSPGHHANLIGNYSHAAIAVVQANNGAYYLTQMFYEEVPVR